MLLSPCFEKSDGDIVNISVCPSVCTLSPPNPNTGARALSVILLATLAMSMGICDGVPSTAHSMFLLLSCSVEISELNANSVEPDQTPHSAMFANVPFMGC